MYILMLKQIWGTCVLDRLVAAQWLKFYGQLNLLRNSVLEEGEMCHLNPSHLNLVLLLK
jgi:hypothetical protein